MACQWIEFCTQTPSLLTCKAERFPPGFSGFGPSSSFAFTWILTLTHQDKHLSHVAAHPTPPARSLARSPTLVAREPAR